jgi:uncharacterized protein YdhG (YjbR/CyaY superfamily)
MANNKPDSIDEYFATFPEETQKALNLVRQTMQKAMPGAEEGISYGIAAFKLDGRFLIYFAGYKKHIGVYPVPNNEPEFEKDFAAYKTSGKGAIQFPLNKPMPLDLITRIVNFRVRELEKKKTP